jgi:hypothetical protein
MLISQEYHCWPKSRPYLYPIGKSGIPSKISKNVEQEQKNENSLMMNIIESCIFRHFHPTAIQLARSEN